MRIITNTTQDIGTSLFQKPFVILHHDLRLQLLIDFQRNGHNDEDTRRREYVHEVVACPSERHRRNKGNEREVNCAEQRNAVTDLFEIQRRRLTGTDALNEAAVLLNALGNVLGVELDLRIEESERKDEDGEHEDIDPPPGRILTGEISVPPGERARPRLAAEAYDHAREGYDGKRKDEGHNAVARYFHGNNGRLTAVHFGAAHLLRILNGNLPFGEIDEYDQEENDHDQHDEEGKFQKHFGVGADFHNFIQDRFPRGGENTDKDNHGNAVADAVFGNALAQPHDEDGARRIDDGHIDDRQRAGIKEQIPFNGVRRGHVARKSARKIDDDTDGLHDRQYDGNDPRERVDFLFSFLALLGPSLQRRKPDRQELHDNGRVDVRSDSERKERTARKRAARDGAHELKEVIALDLGLNKVSRQTGDGNITSDAEYQKDKQGKKNLFPDVLIPKGVFQCFNHFSTPFFAERQSNGSWLSR